VRAALRRAKRVKAAAVAGSIGKAKESEAAAAGILDRTTADGPLAAAPLPAVLAVAVGARAAEKEAVAAAAGATLSPPRKGKGGLEEAL